MQVLIADDCPTTRSVLKKSLLRWGYEPVLAEHGEHALERLTDEGGPRLAILDWNMPRLEGPVVCRRLRDRNAERYAYVIFLTAKGGDQHLAEAMQSGADDFVTKPVSEMELKYRLEAGQRIIELQDRLLRSQQKIQLLSTHDPLTGLLNRSAIFDRLAQELDRVRRKTGPLTIMVVQADGLKSVNQVQGHQAGDQLLVELSDRIKKAIRTYDSVGRIGGNDFIVMLPDTDRQHARVAAERITDAIRKPTAAADALARPGSVTIGIANTLDSGYNLDTLLGHATEATTRAALDKGGAHYACGSEIAKSTESGRSADVTV